MSHSSRDLFLRVREIFDQLMDCEPDARASLLSDYCADDEELRREVEELLAQDTQGPTRIRNALGAAAREAVGSYRLEIGDEVGHFVVESRLGKGGMGEVYRVRDQKLGRQVALKLLPSNLADNLDLGARFHREARALATLSHPGIVTVYSIEDIGGSPAFTMELIEGETLDRTVPPEGLGLDPFFELAVPLLEAVSAAHEHGLVHRDIKPNNVMVTRTGEVKVLDFGLAKALPPTTESPDETMRTATELTQRGTVLGTTGFMAPEQVRGEEADARSDIFSLGVVLYGMLTGQAPFSGQSPIDLASSVLRDDPPPMSRFRQDHPAALETAILRSLEKDPEYRYQSAHDLCGDLAKIRDSRNWIDSSAPDEEPVNVPARSVSTSPRESGVTDEGFWIAVLPFKFRGSDPKLEGLAEEITEEVITGLSRFSYLRVLARSTTLPYASQSIDARTVGAELGARYLLEGTLRQAGSEIRLGVRLIETGSGAHCWAENYVRALDPDHLFELTDDLVARIVSTTADMHGVLPHSMSEALRGRNIDDLNPYEAVLRCFGYIERLTEEEHLEVRALMERIVESAPNHADVLAMLSFVYTEEFKHGFNEQPGALDRALGAARKAVEAGGTNGFAHHVLAQVLFFRRELPAFRQTAKRAVELNPMDGGTVAFMGILMAYAGDWEGGLQLAQRAMELNPNHPGWYHFTSFWNEYRQGDYQAALDVALRISLPSYFHYHGALAMAAGQLGDTRTASQAVEELLALKPDFAQIAKTEWLKWLGEGELLEQALDGLRKAGLPIPIDQPDVNSQSDRR